MKRIPLRRRYTRDIARMGILVFALCLGVLITFNAVEVWKHADTRKEEMKETLVLAGILLATLPIVLWLAWRTGGNLLRPLLQIEEGVKRIRAGELDLLLPTDAAETELAYLAESLNAAFEAHRDAQRKLDRFSANVAHQLRTPLAALRAEGQLCLARNGDIADCRESIGLMLEEAERLAHMVDQLLLLAKISASEDIPPLFESTDLAALTREIQDEFKAPLQERAGPVEILIPSYPVWVNGNPVWLREALANLLNNALTHAPGSAPIRITLSQRDGEAIWRIEDGGPGIPEHLRPALFQRFHRGGNADAGGSGLGLSIVTEIAARHRGRIQTVESPLGGAAFELRLPGSTLGAAPA